MLLFAIPVVKSLNQFTEILKGLGYKLKMLQEVIDLKFLSNFAAPPSTPPHISLSLYAFLFKFLFLTMTFLELCRINANNLGARWKTASFSLASRAPTTIQLIS